MAGDTVRRISPTTFRIARRGTSREVNRQIALNLIRSKQPVRKGLSEDELLREAYRPNGHNHQRPGLRIYLPGNGGLLAAVAMMAAGWDGAPEASAPGFPRDGSWTVRWNGLRRMP